MKLIAHRGNLNGPKPDFENHPEYIQLALNYDYDVEIDVWYVDDWYLGHDEPTYLVDYGFIQKDGLWLHAKNLDALYRLNKTNLVYFWHQNDDFTLTSNGYIWTYPGKELTDNSICVIKEDIVISDKTYGVCSDYISRYKKSN